RRHARRMIALLVLLLLQPLATEPAIPRTEADRLFALAGDLYDAGDYAAAAATYGSILDGGWANGALYHNAGQAYVRAGQLGMAILHLERAAQHLPGDPAVQAHLADARAQVQGDGVVLSTSPLTRIAGGIADALTLDGLLALALLAWIGTLALLGWRVWCREQLLAAQRTRIRRGLLVAAPLALLLLATTVLASVEHHVARGVVLEPMPLAYTPGGALDGVEIAEGLVVRLGAAQGAWQAIVLPDGTEGWLPTTALGRI
ncbi:MAG: hypothetical protein AAGG50_17460, partial [Bacteroidota bacterium]